MIKLIYRLQDGKTANGTRKEIIIENKELIEAIKQAKVSKTAINIGGVGVISSGDLLQIQDYVPPRTQVKKMKPRSERFFDWDVGKEPIMFGELWEVEHVNDGHVIPRIDKIKLIRPAFTVEQKIKWYENELKYQLERFTITGMKDPRLKDYPEKIKELKQI